MKEKKNVIWSNHFDYDEYEEWKKDMLADDPDAWVTEEAYCEYLDMWLDDERLNLDVDIEKGCIVCFASLGLWNGRHDAVCKLKKYNVSDIFDMIAGRDVDYYEFYADNKNVRATGIHHDGRNNYLFRVIRDEDKWDRIVERFSCGEEINEEQFIKMTSSLRPYVAKVFGW